MVATITRGRATQDWTLGCWAKTNSPDRAEQERKLKQVGANMSRALACTIELWHDRVKCKQRPGATNQTFWPASTELMGTLGPHMRILLDQLATRINQIL